MTQKICYIWEIKLSMIKKKCVGLLKVLYNYVVKLHTKVTLLLKYKLKEKGQIYNSAM